MKLLRDQRVRPFVLDIETDSTIAPDENAQKQRATEFITSVGGFLGQALPLVQQVPQAAKLMSETLKYVAGQFRAGRQLEGVIEEFADDMAKVAQQPKPEDPAQTKAAADAEATKTRAMSDAQTAQADAAEKAANAQKTVLEANSKAQDDDLKRRATEQQEMDAAELRRIERDGKQALLGAEFDQKAQKHAQDMDIGVLQLRKLQLEIDRIGVQTEAVIKTTDAKIDQTNTQTDNSVRSTDASVQATAETTAIKADAAKQKEPA